MVQNTYRWRIAVLHGEHLQVYLNLRPFSVFCHLHQWRGGGCAIPVVFWKPGVVELSNKNQRIVLEKYSRLVLRFHPRSIFDPVMRRQM